jgi:CHAD domain-containing protein
MSWAIHLARKSMEHTLADNEPGVSFKTAARQALAEQAEVLFANLAGTREGTDPEALHDMRVASRRLRAAISVFAPAFPPKQIVPIEREICRVTDALGAVRDADVQIAFMEGLLLEAPAEEQPGLASFAADLRARRKRDRKALVREMDRLEKSGLKKAIARLVKTDGGAAEGGTDG